MKRLVLKYWWLLPLLLGAFMMGLMLLFLSVPTIIESIIGIMLLLVVILLPVSWVMLLVDKRWWQCIVSFVSSAFITIVLGFFLSLAAMSGPDGFGREHKIPEGLVYQLPLDTHSDNVVLIDSLDTSTYLQVWNGIQCGIYKYDFHYPPLPAGDVFLRCFEVTKNIPLSEDRLPERSTVSVDSTTYFSQLVNQKEFTIYEGDWEDYYAARIEVWYRDSETKQERKLCEKVYRVEGWMR